MTSFYSLMARRPATPSLVARAGWAVLLFLLGLLPGLARAGTPVQAATQETAATQAAADHASLLTLQAQVARLLGEQPTVAQAPARK